MEPSVMPLMSCWTKYSMRPRLPNPRGSLNRLMPRGKAAPSWCGASVEGTVEPLSCLLFEPHFLVIFQFVAESPSNAGRNHATPQGLSSRRTGASETYGACRYGERTTGSAQAAAAG